MSPPLPSIYGVRTEVRGMVVGTTGFSMTRWFASSVRGYTLEMTGGLQNGAYQLFYKAFA